MSGYRDFAIWLLARQERDDPTGDLAKDFATDIRVRDGRGDLPYRTLGEFRHHVQLHGCTEALAALRAALREYRKAMARRRKRKMP